MVVLGIDIGSVQLRAGMVDEEGAILASRAASTPHDLDGFLGFLQDAIPWLTEATAAPAGAGVGSKGIINPENTCVERVRGSLHYLEGLSLTELLGLPADIPVFADNDARAAMSAEMVWGAARGRRDALLLTLGNGVGGAALVHGSLLRGHTGLAGHLGHYTVAPDGAPCACGNRGCLETVFSARAIEAEAWSAVHRGCSCSLTRLFRDQPQLASCRTVFQAASEGDAVSSAILAHAIQNLAAAIAGMLHLFDPEVVIVGGQIADAGDALFVPLREQVWERSACLLGREVPILEQGVGDRSGIVGAAALAMAPRD